MTATVSRDYSAFIATKRLAVPSAGLETVPSLAAGLYPFQRDLVAWALRRGRAAIFADCGLGKTLMQLAWADAVARDQDRPVLILAPLAVAAQTAREGAKFGISVTTCRSGDDVRPGINIANYEMLHAFDTEAFAGVVLDESSILKSYDGKTRTAIIEGFARTPFRLACTATPAPNDHMELGNHAEFLGVMSRVEMLATFFVHDGGDTSKWRIKGHAETPFWSWVCSWACMVKQPSNLGYSDDGFVLPALRMHEHTVKVDHSGAAQSVGTLFKMEAVTLEEQRGARRESLAARVAACAELVNASDEQWIVWCELNAEGDALEKAINGAVQVSGSDSNEFKESSVLGFADGRIRVLVSKVSIFGFGLNLQHCSSMAFVGLSHSYEQWYQAVRRCWRFGQKREVNCHVVISELEGRVVASIQRKEADAEKMAREMVANMSDVQSDAVRGSSRETVEYATASKTGNGWEMRLGDCVEQVRAMPDASIHYTVFSPPFSSLYTYSASDRDMGNCRDVDEFAQHFRFLVPELYRVTKPGRLLSFHCMLLPTSKTRDGVIGLSDFRGDLIRLFAEAGWIFHSEVVIWKDPVTAMQRTKALGLLHKQIKKDSCMSRQGIPDYLITMRKPGDNPEPVTHTNETFPVGMWQRYASPVWMDINPSDTLQRESAREDKDERHICPLQLEVIRRAMALWTNPGDLVLSPFAGIGSEGYVALQEGRRFLGVELKRSYFDQACGNLRSAGQQLTLLG